MLPTNKEPKGDKIRVALCIPSMMGSFNHDLHVFVYEAAKSNYMKDSPFQFRMHTVSGIAPVHKARNTLANSALKDESDLVWWLDDDCVPPPQSFGLLPAFINDKADIMGAVTPVLQSRKSGRTLTINANGYRYNVAGDMMYTSVKPVPGEPEIIDVDACGMSATVMKIELLKDKRMYLPSTYRGLDGKTKTIDKKHGRVFFRTQEDAFGNILRSEDLDFCTRAKDVGYRIRYHYGIPFGHNKMTNLNGVLQAAADLASDNWRHFAEAEKLEAAQAAEAEEDKPRIIQALG